MRVLPSLACAFLALLCLPDPGHGASYFGDSFCRIHAIQDLSNFHLSLHFKTGKRSGLLLIAAGVEDYLSIELYNGKLQARMNMGAGEIVLSTSQGLQLNNLLDHHVSISLKESKFTMAVDDLFTTDTDVPEGEDDLNIDVGVFLGGKDDLDVSYLNHAVPPFRGCITDVKFESHQFDILASETTDCQDTKEICSDEFEAADGEAISFISPDSFVSLPTWVRTSSAIHTLELLMKTTIEDALLIFHPGRESDFIALGVVGGYLKGVVDLGNGILALDNLKVQLDDDQWHRIKVTVDSDKFEMNVDSQSVSLTIGGTETLDLIGNLYLGGIPGKMKDVFREANYLSRMEEEVTSESFIGCMGEIKVNEKDKSLQDALVTKDVHVKCEGEDYDYSSYDEFETPTTTAPVRIRYVDVIPEDRHCYPTNDMPEVFQNVTKLLDVTALLVPEGGEAYLDINNLHPTFDIAAAGIRQSQIIFTLQNDPWYGLVDMNINSRRTKKFTLLDVASKKIKYLHDGNEKYGDQIQLEVVAHSSGYLPDCLKTAWQYVLPVEILPVNDMPQLSGGDIAITENGRTRLSPNLIKIVDSDTRCDDLVVRVMSESNTPEGYLENVEHPGESISQFTCRQLKDGLIYYVHKGGRGAGLKLMVSDGQSSSEPTTFKLSVTQPQIKLVTNTGLLISQGGHSTIGIQQLAVFVTPRNGDVLYNITQPLRYGELQLTTAGDVPRKVTYFRQSDLEQNHLRYVSTDTSDQEDTVAEYVQFNVHLGQQSLTDNSFLIKITPAKVKVENMAPLEVEAGQQRVISQAELQATVTGTSLEPDSIQYILVKPPILGTLQSQGRELGEGDTFTQQELSSAHISYSPKVQREVDAQDQFQFKVLADNQYSPMYTFPIKILADSNTPVLTNERLTILEGGENILNKEYLWIETPNSPDYVYKILQSPQHGYIFRESPPGQPRFEGAVTVFSNEDLLLNRLIYKHDGSETGDDYFTFQAYEQTEGSVSTDRVESLGGTFRISIQSKNDHVPQRVIDKTFNVVRNGQRLLTTDDILFGDSDSDFNDTQLVYARMGILSGNIVSAADPSQALYRFTQADLRDHKVLFVHHGADHERFQLRISDGLHKTTALLEIQAGDPYLQVVNNSIAVMDHGSTKTLNTTLLSADTNVDIQDGSEIIYEVTVPPSDGRIIVSGIEASQFTQKDLKKGVVSYEHHDYSLKSKDSFSFTVRCKEHSEDGIFRIKIFKQGYLSEPKVINNQRIVSYEGEHTVIDQDHLKVEQPDILPTEMVFTIKQYPQLGHVVKMNKDSESTASPVLDYIQAFTQEDLNKGRILYVSTPVQGTDVFSVDVSNGFTSVEDLEVHVNIVPRLIPVQTFNFTVREGGAVALSQELLNISHAFYRMNNIDFIVEEPPEHGDIRYLEGDDFELSSFTWDEVKRKVVYYLHDSTETTEDSFTLTASDFENTRRSFPITFGVTIIPVNDEPPRLERNTGIEVVVGEEAVITNRELNTQDVDTPKDELIYSVEALTNGMVALKITPDESIDNFTQAQIDNGEIIFIHEGSESGSFKFTVTDGEHTSPLYHFEVTAKQPTITVETGEELMVFPGTKQTISSAMLKASTDEDGDEIRYSLQKSPRRGRLIRQIQRNQFEEITTFSQAELEAGNIYYEHQMPEEPFWVVRDSLQLQSSSPSLPTVLLPITVSFSAADHNVSSQLWKNKGLDVVQGQSRVIDRSRLDASNLLASLPESEHDTQDVLYKVKEFPTHGRLTLAGVDITQDAPYFHQEDVDSDALEYQHDDSGAPSDSFSFRAWLNPHGRGPSSPQQSALVMEEIFRLNVRPRDSSPPELVSLDLLLEVLQGSTEVLSKQYLNTIDEDSTPDEVRFKVLKSPANGQLINADTNQQIKEFTQEDINAERVAFVSDGSLSQGFMEFTVTDGKHHTTPYTLHIGILAHTLVLTKPQEIYVLQGDDQTPITESMLRASTGGPIEEEVLYKITSTPKYAALMVDRQTTHAFTQKQISEGRVSVRFVTSTSPRDSILFLARSRAANVSSVLNITVKPLAKIAKDPLLPRGATVLVDGQLLDATPLANKAKTLPTFTVIQKPKSARFVRMKGEGEGKPVDTFTQKDLDDGLVALEILNNTGKQADADAKDEARLLLKAHGVPPAECVLSFTTAPYSPKGVYGATVVKTPTLPEKNGVSPGRRGNWPYGMGQTTASPNPGSRKTPMVSRRGNLWSILIPILIILLLLILAAVLAYYLVRRNKTGKHNVQTVATKPKNGEVSQETFRKTDPANNIPMSSMDGKEADPELLQHCRTTNPALKKNQYWV
ncbi:chondroitin sulfate proteoglycan 4 [Alosa pseudoharengus]|uniref:chondroitin sulfate proteoglycan 4 n=1 Tax=Alosa pseudoharengus TaxID=34774 RepID=UPI003F887317